MNNESQKESKHTCGIFALSGLVFGSLSSFILLACLSSFILFASLSSFILFASLSSFVLAGLGSIGLGSLVACLEKSTAKLQSPLAEICDHGLPTTKVGVWDDNTFSIGGHHRPRLDESGWRGSDEADGKESEESDGGLHSESCWDG
jgi:hypothetical protein